MRKMLNKKNEYSVNWGNMSIEDKILWLMEGVCYFLVFVTIVIVAWVVKNDYAISAGVLICSAIGFTICAQDARSTRDSFVTGWFKKSKR